MNVFFARNCVFLLSLFALFAPSSQAGMIDKDGMLPWEVCGLCHSANGISRMAKFPKLAGQKADYIEKQFVRFRQGLRQNDGGQMVSITTEVQPDDVAKIAEYFSSLPVDNVQLLRENLREEDQEKYIQGERLFVKGKEGVKACKSCHLNKSSSAPWIDGQHYDYLKKQLNDFSEGLRFSQEGTTSKVVLTSDEKEMLLLSGRLSEAEVDAVSFYLSVSNLQKDSN